MIEAKIDELVAAINRLATAVEARYARDAASAAVPQYTVDGALVVAPAPKTSGRKKAATEPAQPAAAPPAPAAAPAAGPQAPSPAAPSTPSPTLLLDMTNAVIRLANEYDHDTAVAILAKRKVSRCSDVPPTEWQAVLDEAEEAIAKAQAAQSTASLV
jgi:hypothetical protein